MGPDDLEEILAGIQQIDDLRVLIGPGDDAGVCLGGFIRRKLPYPLRPSDLWRTTHSIS